VDFCHKAPIPAVTHRNGSLAIQAYRQLLEWDSHPLVIYAVGARVRFAKSVFAERGMGAAAAGMAESGSFGKIVVGARG